MCHMTDGRLKPEAIELCSNCPHQYVLWRSRLDQHAGAVLNSPPDDHLLSNAVILLSNLPDDGVLRINSKDLLCKGLTTPTRGLPTPLPNRQSTHK